jgi:acylphosphatase
VIRRRLVVTGRVQGVFYRTWFGEQAAALGLDGWVRNRADGSVEAAIQGPSEAVKEMVMLAHQGSPAARVERVAVSDDAPAETLSGFAQRPTV